MIPPILRLQNFFQYATHPRAVFDMHTPEPRLEQRRFFRREPESCAEGVIPMGVIGAEVPCPGAAGRRFEGEAEPRFLFPECRFGAGALDGVPGPLGDLANELDFPGRPHPRRVVIGAERGNHPAVFEQPQADKRRDLPRPECRPVVVAEPLIRLHVADDDHLAAQESLAQLRPHGDSQRPSDERRDAAGVLAPDDVFAALGFRVADAGCAEVLAEMLCGNFLDGRRVAQRADRVVQPEKKREPLFVRPQFGLRLAVLERRPDAIGNVLNEGYLVGRPDTRRAAVDGEYADETAVLDQQRTNVRADARRLQRRALLRGVTLGRRVVDRQRPTLQDVRRAAAGQIAPLEVAGQ